MMDNDFVVSTVNREVMTTPFKEEFVKKGVSKTGLVVLEQKTQFAALRVLADNYELNVRTNDVVYVPADLFRANWAIKKYDFMGTEMILVPIDAIKMVGKK